MAESGLQELVLSLEQRMEKLEGIQAPIYSQDFELGVVYFQLSLLYERIGRKEDAANYRTFSQTQIKKVTALTNNDPIFLEQAKLMYEYFDEPLPPELAAAIEANKTNKPAHKPKQGFLSRLLGGYRNSEDNGYRIDGETVDDAILGVTSLDRSLELRQKRDKISARNNQEDLAYALEHALIAGMVVASLDDYELECGVERDYLETILPAEELADMDDLRARVLSGDIDLSNIPSSFTSYDFGEQILVDANVTAALKHEQRKLAYLEAKLRDTKDPQQIQALTLLRDQATTVLAGYQLALSDPETACNTGLAVKISGPVDIGTANERKMFYFWCVVTRALKGHLPAMERNMGELVLGLQPDYEDVDAGRAYLLEKIPVFREIEAFGVLEMSCALNAVGQDNLRHAVRGLISSSEGTPYAAEGNRAVRLLNRVIDSARSLIYSGRDAIESQTRPPTNNDS